MLGKLALDVGEVTRRQLQPMCHHLADMKQQVGSFGHEGVGVLDQIEPAGRYGLDGCRVRLIEQNGHLAEDRTGFGGCRNLDIPTQDLHLAFNQNVELVCRFSLYQENRSRLQLDFRQVLAALENGDHDGCQD